VIAVPAVHLSDRPGPAIALALGAAAFTASFVGFAYVGASVAMLALLFALAGVGIGVAETAQSAAVAHDAPPDLRGSAFGLVAAVQAFANLLVSLVAGALWHAVSPKAAFLYLAGWSTFAAIAFAVSMRARG